MSERAIFLDEGPGETRAVVTIDGAPERLMIERAGLDYPRLGARYRARVSRVDRAVGLAWLDLGPDGGASVRLKNDRAPPREGQKVEADIIIEPQGDKPAVARVIDDAEGEPARLAVAPSLEQRLRALAPDAPLVTGRAARDEADEAEAAVLAVEHNLPGGGSIAIERTRALTAVDVDLGSASGEAKRAARQVNLRAIAECARLLRLGAQGGLVVLDLVGRGHDGQALSHALKSAFAADQPGVAFGPVSRFGLVELALPRRLRPLADLLCGPGGAPSADTLALRLLRAIERQAQADPGGRLAASAPPLVIAAAGQWAHFLSGRIGARFELKADPALKPHDIAIRTL
ncbi:MAG TPA: ribonuclease E/G [Caulobacteraceae bacterium]|nr:ribonuclease E/G [Caulobacteraceae bacterium]